MTAAIDLDYRASFMDAINNAGIGIETLPIADGQLHRFKAKGDKSKSDNGWYVLHGGYIPAGAFGCWKRGINDTWCSKAKQKLTPEEQSTFEHQQREARRQRQEEEKQRHSEATIACNSLWDKANPTVDAKHSYLISKQIRAYGIRQLKDTLLVPIRNTDRELASLQFIYPDGSKKFKSGGKKKGCYHSIGKLSTPLYLCEGYATGATIHKLTGCCVVVAFDAGNLQSVAKALIEKQPDTELVIAADNDHQAQNNIGITKARNTALSLGIPMTFPIFRENEEGSDFNDLFALKGREVTKAALSCYQVPEAGSDQNTIPSASNDDGQLDSNEAPSNIGPDKNQNEQANIPLGWLLMSDGVYKLMDGDDKPPTKISGRIWVTALTRGLSGEGWGSITRWIDRDGKEQERAIPQSRFHEMGNTLASELSSSGLQIIPGKERQIASYLGAFETDKRIRAVDSLGWLGDKSGALAFVLPGSIISRDIEPCVFQPEQHSPTTRTMNRSGTLTDWREKVASQCTDNPILLFGLCTAFAGVLIKPAGSDSVGFHIWGRSSGGKTTTGQVAASVWGCGADPADSPDESYIRRWNATANASEALAASHNDNLLVMDELHTCGARDFGALIYNLMGGQGKAALRSDRAMRASRAWRVLILSTGEISAKAKIEESGKAAKGGQLLRFIDIHLPNGSAMQNTNGLPPGEFAKQLKRNCSDYGGTAGPAFLNSLVEQASTNHALSKLVRDLVKAAVDELTPSEIEQEQARAIGRFALVQVAGVLASKLGIIPQTARQVGEAVKFVRDIWMEEHQGISDRARAIHSIREFILSDGSRFRDTDNQEQNIHNLVGYRDTIRDLWLLTDKGFKEACEGQDIKEVSRELLGKDLLFKNDAKRFKSKHTISGMGKGQLRLFAIKGAILSDDTQTKM